jgi:hypothetical protein
MRKFASLGTALACLALAVGSSGCASFERTATERCDHPGACRIAIRVAACTITVDPNDLEVSGKNRVIEWTIDPQSDYVFANDGIVFKDPGNQFSDPRRLNDKMFQWHDRNDAANPVPYRYTVKVQGKAGACPPLDPSIINLG